MPRDIPIGNGNLLLTFDSRYTLRDVYYPFVGQANHTRGQACRFGVWVDGQMSWISEPSWQKTLRYESETLVTEVTAVHWGLGLRLVCRDCVDFDRDLYVRKVEMENPAAMTAMSACSGITTSISTNRRKATRPIMRPISRP